MARELKVRGDERAVRGQGTDVYVLEVNRAHATVRCSKQSVFPGEDRAKVMTGKTLSELVSRKKSCRNIFR